MPSKDKRSQEEHPELTPYAPPRHPDVNIPEQQLDADQPAEKKTSQETGDAAKIKRRDQ